MYQDGYVARREFLQKVKDAIFDIDIDEDEDFIDIDAKITEIRAIIYGIIDKYEN